MPKKDRNLEDEQINRSLDEAIIVFRNSNMDGFTNWVDGLSIEGRALMAQALGRLVMGIMVHIMPESDEEEEIEIEATSLGAQLHTWLGELTTIVQCDYTDHYSFMNDVHALLKSATTTAE